MARVLSDAPPTAGPFFDIGLDVGKSTKTAAKRSALWCTFDALVGEVPGIKAETG